MSDPFVYDWDVEEKIHAFYDQPLMKPPAKNPCIECPWRRNALPGYLGPHTAEEWVEMAHADGQIACHMTIDPGHDDDDYNDIGDMTTCAGATIFRRNVCKSPRLLRGMDEYELPSDRERVFARNDEFVQHHTIRRKHANSINDRDTDNRASR